MIKESPYLDTFVMSMIKATETIPDAYLEGLLVPCAPLNPSSFDMHLVQFKHGDKILADRILFLARPPFFPNNEDLIKATLRQWGSPNFVRIGSPA